MTWTERWGFDGDVAEVERMLGLVSGRYRTQRTGETVTRPDPLYSAQSQTFVIERISDTANGRSWDVGLNEITNGIYALIYRDAREERP